LAPHLRYSTQTAADFYQVAIADGQAIPQQLSSDYRLADLTGLTYGAKLSKTFGDHKLSLGLEQFVQKASGDTLSNAEKRELLDWVIRPALRAVPGVADVNALGGEVRAYTLVPDWWAMQTYQVTLEDVLDVVERNNVSDGAGRVSQGEEVLLVRSTPSKPTGSPKRKN
jgi:hypothetical protein